MKMIKMINVRPSHLNNLTPKWFILKHNAGGIRDDWWRGCGPEHSVQRGNTPVMRRAVMWDIVIKWSGAGVVIM